MSLRKFIIGTVVSIVLCFPAFSQEIGNPSVAPSRASTPPGQAAPAQAEPVPSQQGGIYTFKKTTSEVLLHATVLDDKDRSVRGLTKDDFQVFENNVPQHINYFDHADAPVSVGILIDNSGSMREKRSAVNRDAINFVKASNVKDEVFIVNFNDEYYLDADFTNDMAKLQEGLDRIESRGGTALYDALIASLDHLGKAGRKDKKVLLVITDGADNSSRYTLEQTVRMAEAEKGPIIYCIGIVDQEDTRSERRHAEKALKELATATGGVAYFPKDLGQVDYITRQVAADIRDQYELSYHSNQNGPGFRTIRVEARAPHMKHLSVRTRSGYYGSELSQPAGASGR